jgi:cytochrome P450
MRHHRRLLPEVLQRTKRYSDAGQGKSDPSAGLTWTAKWPFSPRFIFTACPRNVEYILHDAFRTYVKGPVFFSRLVDLLGHGIFNVDGEAWFVQRKMAAHMFSLAEFRTTIMQSLRTHGAELWSILRLQQARGDETEVQQLFHRFTLDSIGDVAFGHTLGALRQPALPFAAAFDTAQAICEQRFLRPFPFLQERLDGSRAVLARCLDTLNGFCMGLVAQRRREGWAGRHDLLSRFMAALETDTGGAQSKIVESLSAPVQTGLRTGHWADSSAASAAPSPTPPSAHSEQHGDDAFLRDVILNFLIAGRDTTAQALTWATYLLSLPQHAAIQDAVAAEARALLPSLCQALAAAPAGTAAEGGMAEGTPGDDAATAALRRDLSALTYEDVAARLPFLHATVRETLRLFPSVPKDLKQATADDRLPDGTLVRAGDFVCYLPYVMGRLEQLWGPTAAQFDPARFLPPNDHPSPFKFIAFNAGPRICLGMNMALTEACFVLAVVFGSFRSRLAPSQTHSPEPLESLTLPVGGGLRVFLSLRQD